MLSSPQNGADIVFGCDVVGMAPLTAECTLREIRPGEWLALGSVHHASGRHASPARILVGQGRSHSEALTQLKRELLSERSKQVRRGALPQSR